MLLRQLVEQYGVGVKVKYDSGTSKGWFSFEVIAIEGDCVTVDYIDLPFKNENIHMDQVIDTYELA